MIARPTNPMVSSLLNEMYHVTTAYAYWKAGKHLDRAVFDLCHCKPPFGGEFTVFAGLEECLRFVANFGFEDCGIDYLRSVMPSYVEDEFFGSLKALDCSQVIIHAIPEGTVVFPRVPLIRIEGPLWVVQLLETTFLALVNYASLVATNAARYRLVAGSSKVLLEFGLRRAQGPDGSISASKYCYLGGFDFTSNLEAGRLFGIPVGGTHSHAFVSSFMGLDEIALSRTSENTKFCKDFGARIQHWLSKLKAVESLHVKETNESELAAFGSYALAFPEGFLALVDTYDVMKSGVPNFCAVALALHSLGYKARGIRLDSGDLSYLSKQARAFFRSVEEELNISGFGNTTIIASNDINEDTIDALTKQADEINGFGIGTQLVTCYKQPALGCIYKLVEVNGHSRIKISEDVAKVTIPCKKQCYRLYGEQGFALVDLMQKDEEPAPQADEPVLCRHPFNLNKVYVVPKRVEPLLQCYWKGSLEKELPSLKETREYCRQQLAAMRPDHMRIRSPTSYKVSVSAQLYDDFHTALFNEGPVKELR
ncbi:nicotinate phosphoribosyltransferase 2 [Selaginella moellendorffii]|uniref:nicotinate phosphoribosyltransferase 2 n=1 Tax=Selaginella moellendorffii TaxID=88036 RepID=UPI000D1CBB7A|nr:nicotinate phosphoribosyltransferase 2 [Selaginella moellendorffii]|eukprot:XP_024515334.1 nicotinate phosphoribosyltransferase 2 [Selaginella moellendorffii]